MLDKFIVWLLESLQKGAINMEKWIARDMDGALWEFEEKPVKVGDYWGTTGDFRPLEDADVPGSENIRWEDDEPTVYRDDMVNHPSHYNKSNIEVIDVIKMALTPEEYQGFLKGNVLKYELRAQHKANPEEDYAKSKFYYDKTLEIGKKVNYVQYTSND